MNNETETAINAAADAGRQFAEYLNEHPEDGQNWGEMHAGDDLPEFDYVTLRDEHGDVTSAMGLAYRDAFNSARIAD